MPHTFPTETHLHIWNPAGDAFGRQELAKNVVKNILTKMDTPNVLGIYGDWGTGKTTFLHYLQMVIKGRQMDEDGGYRVIEELKDFRAFFKEEGSEDGDLDLIEIVHFEPWKYEYAKDADLLFALLDCINEKLDIKDDSWKNIGSAVVDISRDVLKEIAYSFFRNKIGVDFSEVFQKLGVGIDRARIEKFGEVLPEYEAWFSQFDNLQKLFGKFIDTGLAKQQKKKLIIFIDDLDRCLPENTIKLLEAMKNFLYKKGVIFVLAVDRRVVSEMIDQKYGLSHGYGSEYLEKIINFHIDLPKKSFKNVLKEMFIMHGFDLLENHESYCNLLDRFLFENVGEPRRSKRIVGQFLMQRYVSMNNNIESWYITETKALYLFFATYLRYKWPQHFCKSSDKLKNIFTICDKMHSHYTGTSTKTISDIVSKDSTISIEDISQIYQLIYSQCLFGSQGSFAMRDLIAALEVLKGDV